MFYSSNKPVKISFLKFYFPLILLYVSFAVMFEGLGIYYWAVDKEWQSIFLVIFGAPHIPLLISSLKVWDIKDWNFVVINETYMESFTLSRKKLYTLDTQKTVYYAELVVPDTISRSQIVYVLSNEMFSLTSAVDFRDEFDSTSQMLVIANTKSSHYIPKSSWFQIKSENDERVWL